MLDPTVELGDLHIHVGGAVAPHILWSIAHEQGFKLPVQTFWEFRDLVSASPDKVASQDDYLDILHRWTEKIQSSPAAVERSVHEIIGKESRSSRVTLLELRGDVDACAELLARPRAGGLGVTVHTGETPSTGAAGLLTVLDKWRPTRIGHGIAAAHSEEAMRKLVEQDVVLEICPSSNLR